MKTLNNKNKLIIGVTLIVTLIIIMYFLLINSNTSLFSNIDHDFDFINGDAKELKNISLSNNEYSSYEAYIDELNKENYTIDNPLVIVNPFMISPQSALLLFKTSNSESIKITIKGKNNDDIVTNFNKSKNHIIPLYGLYGNYENTVVIESSSGKVNTIKVKVENYNSVIKADKIINKSATNDYYFATSTLGPATICYDKYGEVRWYLNSEYSNNIIELDNGHLLLSNGKAYDNVYSTTGFIEIDLLGYVYNEYILDSGYTYSGTVLDNGHLLLISNGLNMGSKVVEYDLKKGKIVNELDIAKIIRKIDEDMNNNYPTWAIINSVSYLNDNILISLRNINSVISINYKTLDINWIFSDKKYWTDTFSNYLLKSSYYPLGQGSVEFIDNNTFSIFNNGYDAYLEEEESCDLFVDSESYAVTYNVDIQSFSANVINKFGGREYYSFSLGNYHNYQNTKLFANGWHFKSTSDNCTQFNNSNIDSNIIELDQNNNIINKLHVNHSIYNVIKKDLYKDNNGNYKVDKYIRYTNDSNVKKISKKEAINYRDSELLSLSLNFNDYIISDNFITFKDDELTLVFISNSGNSYECFIKDDGNNACDLKNIKKGKYYIFANYNNKYYYLNQFINIK